jgi:CobQ-like glutamine amidotransferase family enzyme
MTTSAVRIGHVYPELLGTYSDFGNVLVLERRLAWRGIDAEIVSVPVGEAVPTTCDVLVLGGGEDDAQALACQELQRGHFKDAIASGTTVFAVCAGLQLLGTTFATSDDDAVAGLDVLDLRTERLSKRAVGEIVTDSPVGPLTGFENHGGATFLGPGLKPLGTVVEGRGNNDADDGEGVASGQVVGTYLHGPVLARNPGLADHLLRMATGLSLKPLDDHREDRLRAERLAAQRRRPRRRERI